MVLIVISHDSKNFEWSLSGVSDFEERMIMGSVSLALLTKVKVITNGAFVSNSLNSIHATFITDVMSVDNILLLMLFLLWFKLGFGFDFAFNHRLFDKLFFNFANQVREHFFEFFFNLSLSNLAN